jgi:hypothetical protein
MRKGVKNKMKKILISLAAVLIVVGGIVALSAFEAHVINVTAHIENALSVSPQGINFGTVFPQEYMEKPFTISLSESFMDEERVDDVEYKLVQKEKPWTLNFGDKDDVDAHNRSLIFVDPDPGKGEGYNIAGGVLTITTGNDIEDLFGQNEVAADWTAPRMVIPMGGNFIIETKVTATPMDYPGASDNNAYQSGGILVYESNGNVIRLELTNFTGLASTVVYMESQMAAVKTGKGWDGLGGATSVWLRLSRNDNTFMGEYSLDGIAWNPVTTQEGNFVNGNILSQPRVGLAVTDNNEDGSNSSFSADFDYIAFNGGYLNLCPFLSKTNDDEDGSETENDVSHSSYFVPAESETPAYCHPQGQIPDATGRLSKIIGDIVDTWNIDLKVPPVVGNVGQDWPESCSQYVVPENEADYGCDLWVEVTNISEQPR